SGAAAGPRPRSPTSAAAGRGRGSRTRGCRSSARADRKRGCCGSATAGPTADPTVAEAGGAGQDAADARIPEARPRRRRGLSLLALESVAKTYGDRRLLDAVSLLVGEGDRIGL